jgi:hypothetical protein
VDELAELALLAPANPMLQRNQAARPVFAKVLELVRANCHSARPSHRRSAQLFDPAF